MTKGDFGQTIVVRVSGIALSDTDTQSLVIRKPDGAIVTKTPVVVDDERLSYTLVSGDLDQSGTYCAEVILTWGFLVDPPGKATSTVSSFIVDPVL